MVWSADSSHVDVELVVNKIRTTSSTPVDFSDAALIEALDDAEDEGADVAVYRQYIADHPGTDSANCHWPAAPIIGERHRDGWSNSYRSFIRLWTKYLLRLRSGSRSSAEQLQVPFQVAVLQNPKTLNCVNSLFCAGKDISLIWPEKLPISMTIKRQNATLCTENCNVPCEVPLFNYTNAPAAFIISKHNQADCVETYRDGL